MNFKSDKGFSLGDIIIAIFIFILFSSIMISISYNIYINSNFTKRNTKATSYIVEVFEYAKSLTFDQITEDNLVSYVNGKNEKIEAVIGRYSKEVIVEKNAYTMFINFDEENINEEQRMFLKKIDITILYKLGSKTKTVSMSTIVSK